MHALSYADELTEIRGEIARLKAREAVLRDLILKAPDIGTKGRWNRVELVQSCQRRFVPALLPEVIRQDPAFHVDRVVTILRCLPLHPPNSPRPGWPIQREVRAMH